MASTTSPEPLKTSTEESQHSANVTARSTADLLPTPQPSTEIAAGKSPKLKSSLVLPPAAMGDLASGTIQSGQTQGQSQKHSLQKSQARPKSSGAGSIESRPMSSDVKGKNKNKRPSSSGFMSINSDPDYRPPKTRHTSTSSSRRDSVTGPSTQMPGSGVQLPSPPTRARRIIQMKPHTVSTSVSTASAIAAKDGKSNPDTITAETASAQGKRKSTGKGASSKKTARKTAHSLIERRRRSKMNEEFATLKGLVPACEGQDMHKLAILQAAIDYVRYLQGCVDELQKGGNVKAFQGRENAPQEEMEIDDGDANEAEEDEDAISEDLDERGALPSTSLSTVSPEVPVLNSGMASMQTSPNWTLPSPHMDALPASMNLPRPMSRMDLESRPESVNSGRDHAQRTAEALLMLTTDSRDWDGTRGMSVRDLLSNTRE